MFNRKKLISIPIILLACSSLFASKLFVGLEAGYSYSMINTATRWDNTKESNGHGFDLSVPVEYKFYDWLSLDTGVRYIMKSSKYYKDFYDDDNKTTIVVDDYIKTHHFIEIPLTVRFSTGDDTLRVFLGLGGYVGFRLGGIYAGKSLLPTFESQDFFQVISLNVSDNLFDAGLIAECGLSYMFDPGYLYITARYQYGLTSLTNQKNGVNTYFNNLSVDAGFMFRVGGEK